jgi:hypothetical protein
MGAASSEFAEQIFSGVVFGLVANKYTKDNGSADSLIWIPNKETSAELAKCFSMLLSNEGRSNALATETLKVLFRFAQDHFLHHDC